jgi:hypothetical protein
MGAQLEDSFRLQKIANDFYEARISRDEARSAVIDVVFDRLHCSRVSLWKFQGLGTDLSLMCFASKVAGGRLDTTPSHLVAAEYRDYFNAIIERGTYVGADTMNDPALQPMREHYLVPHNVLSMLDAAFLLNGRAYGMVCCEETMQRRDWRAGEVFALRSIVTKLALLMSGSDDPNLVNNPSMPMRALWPDMPGPTAEPAERRR